MMSGVTASSTLTVVLTPYTTAEPAASATASKVQPCNRPANIRTSNGFISDKGSAHGWGISGTKKPRKPGPFGGVGGIRTLGTGEPVRRISNPVHSTTLPPLRSVEVSDSSRRPQGFRGAMTAALRGAMVMNTVGA